MSHMRTSFAYVYVISTSNNGNNFLNQNKADLWNDILDVIIESLLKNVFFTIAGISR